MADSININGFLLDIVRIPNITLFAANIEYTQVQVPTFYIESQKIWMENTMHPDYIDAKEVEIIEKNIGYFNFILNNSVILPNSYLQEVHWKKHYKKIYKFDENIGKSEQLLFLLDNVFLSEADKNILIDNVCLTENRINNIFTKIVVTRNSERLYTHPLKNSVNTGIDYEQIQIGEFQLVNPVDEYNCCTKSGMNWNDWINNLYSFDTMATTLALYRLSRLVEIHSEDAMQIESERKNKK